MMTKKFCPHCKSEEIIMDAGGQIGIWVCKDCGFRGSIFPEKEIKSARRKNDAKNN